MSEEEKREEGRDEFWTAAETRAFKIAGKIFLAIAIIAVIATIWPLPQLFGHRTFWRDRAAEEPAQPSAAPEASQATLESIAKDLAAFKEAVSGETGEFYYVRYDLDGLYSVGQFPWLYVTAVDEHSVRVSPSKLGRPVEYFRTDKVALVSFADKEKPGGVARRLKAEDVANGKSILLSVVAWGQEQDEEGDGYVVGLILADAGPPTTPLTIGGKVMTVGERCQRLVGELLAKEAKQKSAAEAADEE